MHRHSPSGFTEETATTILHHRAYAALIERGLVAGLSTKQITNALMETTGATEQSILEEMRILARP